MQMIPFCHAIMHARIIMIGAGQATKKLPSHQPPLPNSKLFQSCNEHLNWAVAYVIAKAGISGISLSLEVKIFDAGFHIDSSPLTPFRISGS